jgi:hypothetical protein
VKQICSRFGVQNCELPLIAQELQAKDESFDLSSSTTNTDEHMLQSLTTRNRMLKDMLLDVQRTIESTLNGGATSSDTAGSSTVPPAATVISRRMPPLAPSGDMFSDQSHVHDIVRGLLGISYSFCDRFASQLVGTAYANMLCRHSFVRDMFCVYTVSRSYVAPANFSEAKYAASKRRHGKINEDSESTASQNDYDQEDDDDDEEDNDNDDDEEDDYDYDSFEHSSHSRTFTGTSSGSTFNPRAGKGTNKQMLAGYLVLFTDAIEFVTVGRDERPRNVVVADDDDDESDMDSDDSEYVTNDEQQPPVDSTSNGDYDTYRKAGRIVRISFDDLHRVNVRHYPFQPSVDNASNVARREMGVPSGIALSSPSTTWLNVAVQAHDAPGAAEAQQLTLALEFITKNGNNHTFWGFEQAAVMCQLVRNYADAAFSRRRRANRVSSVIQPGLATAAAAAVTAAAAGAPGTSTGSSHHHHHHHHHHHNSNIRVHGGSSLSLSTSTSVPNMASSLSKRDSTNLSGDAGGTLAGGSNDEVSSTSVSATSLSPVSSTRLSLSRQRVAQNEMYRLHMLWSKRLEQAEKDFKELLAPWSGSWKIVRQSELCESFVRPVKGKPTVHKMVGIVEAPPFLVFYAHHFLHNRLRWDSILSADSCILEDIDDRTDVMYLRQLSGAFASDREYIDLRRWTEEKDGSIMDVMTGIEDHPNVRKSRGVVRGYDFMLGILYEPVRATEEDDVGVGKLSDYANVEAEHSYMRPIDDPFLVETQQRGSGEDTDDGETAASVIDLLGLNPDELMDPGTRRLKRTLDKKCACRVTVIVQTRAGGLLPKSVVDKSITNVLHGFPAQIGTFVQTHHRTLYKDVESVYI